MPFYKQGLRCRSLTPLVFTERGKTFLFISDEGVEFNLPLNKSIECRGKYEILEEIRPLIIPHLCLVCYIPNLKGKIGTKGVINHRNNVILIDESLRYPSYIGDWVLAHEVAHKYTRNSMLPKGDPYEALTDVVGTRIYYNWGYNPQQMKVAQKVALPNFHFRNSLVNNAYGH